MNAVASHTKGGGFTRWTHMMRAATVVLVMGLCAVSAGCLTASGQRTGFAPARNVSAPSTATPLAIVNVTDNQPITDAAAEELGAEAAAAIPDMERAAPTPIEPGAAAIVQIIRTAINESHTATDRSMRISLNEIRNQSRATSSEFNALCERLCDVLNRAAADQGGLELRFTCNGAETVQYRLQGAAYVINVGGFDVWELFLSMTPAQRDWSIWQAARPVRVLRQPRPGQPQVLAW